MPLHPLRLAALCFALLSVSNAHASCGSSACSINTNWDEHSVSRPGLSMDLRESYSRADQLRSGSSRIAADTANNGEVENLRTINRITTLSADYTMDEHWGLVANLPYVSRDHNHNLGPYTGNTPAGYESFQAQALGDIRVLGRYQQITDETAHASAGIKFGLKLNTGRHDFTLNTGVKPNEFTLQPGNGSTDLILCLFWNRAAPGNAWSWFTQGSVQGSARHDASFRPGNQINLDAGTRYAFGKHLSGLLQLNLQWNSKDSGANAALTAAGEPSSGGRTLAVTPGLIYAMTTSSNLYGLLQLPLYQYVNGEQLTASKALIVGINQRF